jgi:hypothetical protein
MEPNLDAQIAHATDVQNRYADLLLSKPHVVGVAVGFAQQDGQTTRQIALVVMVDEKLPAAQLAEDDLLPSEIEGVRVDVQSMGGSFHAQ